jgi:nitroreductase
MELIDVIHLRKSIRKFKSDPVPDNYLQELLEAGRWAPSGSNIQATRYVVIKSPEERSKINECTPLPFVARAPLIIACCIDNQVMTTRPARLRELMEAGAFLDTPLPNTDAELAEYLQKKSSIDQSAMKAYLSLNAAIAIDHITLRAADLGLGSCWVMTFDNEKTKKILKLEDRYDVVVLLPVGYPDQAPQARPRIPLEKLIIKEI